MAVDMMGTAFAHSGQKAQSWDHFRAMFRFVPVGETCFYWYKPETKEQSKQWTCSEKIEDYPIGWKCDGHRFLGFTRCDLHHLAKKKVLFHHDNAPAHISAIVKAKMVDLGYELLPHSQYSPDLPHGFFFVFKLQKVLRRAKIRVEWRAHCCTEACFVDLERMYFPDRLKKLECRWVKCIELRADYVEKHKRILSKVWALASKSIQSGKVIIDTKRNISIGSFSDEFEFITQKFNTIGMKIASNTYSCPTLQNSRNPMKNAEEGKEAV